MSTLRINLTLQQKADKQQAFLNYCISIVLSLLIEIITNQKIQGRSAETKLETNTIRRSFHVLDSVWTNTTLKCMHLLYFRYCVSPLYELITLILDWQSKCCVPLRRQKPLTMCEHIRLQRVIGRADQASHQVRDCFSVSQIFLIVMKALKAATEKRCPVINDSIIVDALVLVTVNSQQRPALSISSRVLKCM